MCTKMLKKMSEKLRAKFRATTPSFSMVKIGCLDDSFLEVFLTSSKPSRKPITAAKSKDTCKEKKRKGEKFKTQNA